MLKFYLKGYFMLCVPLGIYNPFTVTMDCDEAIDQIFLSCLFISFSPFLVLLFPQILYYVGLSNHCHFSRFINSINSLLDEYLLLDLCHSQDE